MPLKLEDLLDIPSQSDCAALCLVINSYLKIEIRAGFDSQLSAATVFFLAGAGMIPESSMRNPGVVS